SHLGISKTVLLDGAERPLWSRLMGHGRDAGTRPSGATQVVVLRPTLSDTARRGSPTAQSANGYLVRSRQKESDTFGPLIRSYLPISEVGQRAGEEKGGGHQDWGELRLTRSDRRERPGV